MLLAASFWRTGTTAELWGGIGMSVMVKWMPDVLMAHGRNSAISVLRALKNARERLEENMPEGVVCPEDQAALDDLEFMIERMANGRTN